MDDELCGRQRTEAGRDGEALEGQKRPIVPTMRVVAASTRRHERLDDLLGVRVQRIGERAIRNGGEHGPQRSRRPDQDPERATCEPLQAGLAHDGVERKPMCDLETRVGESLVDHWGTPYYHCVPAHLHHELVTGARAASCFVLTHGIYGAGHNWRTIARKLVDKRPDWTVALVDLRHHGRSTGGDPPNTLAACADDLRALIDTLAETLALPVTAIGGHSFGGKVVLATRHLVPTLTETWILDSSPSAGTRSIDDTSDTVIAVLELMERLPKRWAKRDDFVAAVVDAGQDINLARWLATNVVADAGEYVLRLDLAAVREMLTDYFARDLWADMRAPQPGSIEIVVADRASTVTASDRAKLAEMPPHVHVHHVDTGHWLHVDAPDTILDLFASRL